MNNQPASLGPFTAFRENPFPVKLEMPAGYVIAAPVTVELWFNKVKQVALVIPVDVTGQDIEFTFSVAQLRLLSRAWFYVLFDGEYVFGSPIESTMEASAPTSRTVSIVIPSIGVVKVSAYSDQVSVAIATAQAAIAMAQAVIATEKAAEIAADSVDIGQLKSAFEVLSESLIVPESRDWIAVGGAAAGSAANGASVNLANKTFTIPAASTGVATTLRRSASLSLLTEMVIGRRMQILVGLSESVIGKFASVNIIPTLKVNGNAVAILDQEVANDNAGQISLMFEYNLLTLTDTIEVSITVGPAAAAPGADVTYTWNTFGVYYRQKELNQTVDLIADSVVKSEASYLTLERMALMSKAAFNNTVDDTARIQDEADDAMDAGRDYGLGYGLAKITSKLVIKGSLEIFGRGGAGKSKLCGDFVGNVIEVATNLPFTLRDFAITRTNAAIAQVGIGFGGVLDVDPPVPVNMNSEIRRISFEGIDTGVQLFSCEGLTLEYCKFFGVKAPLVSGSTTDYFSVKNTKVQKNKFGNIPNTSLAVMLLNGFTGMYIDDNWVYTTTPTVAASVSPYFVRVGAGVGTSETLSVAHNRINAFGTAAILMSTDAANKIFTNVDVFANKFINPSNYLNTSTGININATHAGAIVDVGIEGNIFYNRNKALVINRVSELFFNGNRLHGISATSKVGDILNSTYREGVNRAANQQAGFEFPTMATSTRINQYMRDYAFLSPDGLVKAVLSIDNAGAPVWTTV